MAIPKLLQQMRHAVQDTGDEMTGDLTIENSSMASLIVGNDSDNRVAVTRTAGISATTVFSDGGFWMGSGTDSIHFISGEGSISGLADPEDASDVATKNYVDNNGGSFIAECDVTTLEELQTAYSQGKSIKVLYNNKFFALTSVGNITNNLPTFFKFTYSWANNGHSGVIQSITYDSSSWIVWSAQYLPICSNTSDGDNHFTNSNFMNGASDLTVGQARNIAISTSAPTSSDGNVGDIWIQYFE